IHGLDDEQFPSWNSYVRLRESIGPRTATSAPAAVHSRGTGVIRLGQPHLTFLIECQWCCAHALADKQAGKFRYRAYRSLPVPNPAAFISLLRRANIDEPALGPASAAISGAPLSCAASVGRWSATTAPSFPRNSMLPHTISRSR